MGPPDPGGKPLRALTPEELELAHGPSVAERAVDLVVAQREKLYWKMVSEGKLSSQGWRIAECLNIEAGVITYACWPYRPDAKPEEKQG
jgi:hypothetical protein